MKRVKYQEGKFALGSILCAVIPKDEKVVLAKYLHIYLHWNREELLVSQMKGMANVSLPMNKIADVLVTVPSIEKQQEIIDLEVQLVEKELSIEKLLSDQLTQLENLNQAILQEAVQGKLVKQDKKDEPAIELHKRIKAEKAKSGKKEKLLPLIKPEEIPFEIPDSWVWCRLGEIINVKSSKRVFASDYVSSGIPFFRSKEIGLLGSGNEPNDLLYISNIRFREIKQNFGVPKCGDILLTCVGTIGNTWIVDERDFYYKDGNLVLLESIDKIDTSYLLYFLRSSFFIESAVDRSFGSAYKAFTIVKINKSLFPLPPLSEQKRIVAEIEKQLAKTKQLKEHIIANQQATEQLLKALLHQAFEVEEMEEV
jgi:type I restriction enzyme S subunit